MVGIRNHPHPRIKYGAGSSLPPSRGKGFWDSSFDRLPSTGFLRQASFDRLPSTGFLRQASFDRLPSTGFLRQAQDERFIDLPTLVSPLRGKGLGGAHNAHKGRPYCTQGYTQSQRPRRACSVRPLMAQTRASMRSGESVDWGVQPHIWSSSWVNCPTWWARPCS